MKLLDKYLFKNLLPPFFLGVAFATLILLVQKFIVIFDMLIGKGINFFTTMRLFLYMLPFTFAVTIPMGVAVSVFVAYCKLHSGGELMPFLVAGIDEKRLFLPAIFFGIITTFICIFLNEYVLPEGNFAFKSLYAKISIQSPLFQLEEHTLVKIENRIFGVNKINHRKKEIEDVTIYEEDRVTGNVKKIVAKKGKILYSGLSKLSDKTNYHILKLKLYEGKIFEPSDSNPDEFHIRPFKELIITTKQQLNIILEQEKTPREINSHQLIKRIKKYKNKNIDVNDLLVELHKKIAIPFACLALCLVGPPLSLLVKRGGRGLGLGLSVGLIIFYYLVLVFGENLSYEKKMSPFLGIWAANLILFFGSVFLIFRKK